mmetsp:Transcript_37929/g.107252  ORF Transcript_37929/g.107252 Transcript_37929/m.107252 type:complete len:229 (-) Transcript_37929:215-901(-)
MSPAAKTPGTDVAVPRRRMTYPPPSNSTCPRRNPVCGSWPMAMNAPDTSIRSGSPPPRRTITWLSSPPPWKDSTVVFHRTRMEGCPRTRPARALPARREPPRCITVTARLDRARWSASSIAVSPPPTTATSRPRKGKPSQVAQALTPLPRRPCSPGTRSHLVSAPQARTRALASSSRPEPFARTRRGRAERLTRRAGAPTKRAPKPAAWRRMTRTRPGPVASSPTTPG